MLDQTEGFTEVSGKDLAIGIQFSSTIGQARSLTMTTGIPLDCTKAELDGTLDKIRAAMDRQKILHDLEQTRMLLKNEEQNLHQHRQQFTAQQIKFEADWVNTGRKGDFRPAGGQKSVLEGLEKNEQNSIERIVKLRKDIEEMEGRCR